MWLNTARSNGAPRGSVKFHRVVVKGVSCSRTSLHSRLYVVEVRVDAGSAVATSLSWPRDLLRKERTNRTREDHRVKKRKVVVSLTFASCNQVTTCYSGSRRCDRLPRSGGAAPVGLLPERRFIAEGGRVQRSQA